MLKSTLNGRWKKHWNGWIDTHTKRLKDMSTFRQFCNIVIFNTQSMLFKRKSCDAIDHPSLPKGNKVLSIPLTKFLIPCWKFLVLGMLLDPWFAEGNSLLWLVLAGYCPSQGFCKTLLIHWRVPSLDVWLSRIITRFCVIHFSVCIMRIKSACRGFCFW